MTELTLYNIQRCKDLVMSLWPAEVSFFTNRGNLNFNTVSNRNMGNIKRTILSDPASVLHGISRLENEHAILLNKSSNFCIRDSSLHWKSNKIQLYGNI